MHDIFALYKDNSILKKLVEKLKGYNGSKIKIMEVCGTHTMAISRFGIKSILNKNIKLVSGPGCPVCVTPSYYIKTALELSNVDDIIIATFGDMMKIPYKKNNLLKQKALGKDIRVVYSPYDCINIATNNPKKRVVFLSVGFETTTPIIASMLIEANNAGIKNLFLLTSNKTIDEPLKLLSSDKEIGISGYIYPGHVGSIIGNTVFKEISKDYKIPGVITGFEPYDILYAINILVEYIQNEIFEVNNLYSRVVKPEGNKKALGIMYEVFETADSNWRGLGNIKNSGLKLNKKYQKFDAWNLIENIALKDEIEHPLCKCGEILKGKYLPTDCKLFSTICTKENPMGSCMVSSEGTCAAYVEFKDYNLEE